MINKKLFIVVNVDWFFLSHRLPIALAAKKNGYDVTIVSKNTGRKSEIESYGLKFVDIAFDRSGSNPIYESKCIYRLYKLYKSQKPDIIHQVTLKACILGSLAAKLAKQKNIVNAISGLGYNFIEERNGIKQKIMRLMMRLAFKSNWFHYIFQNMDDITEFESQDFANKNNIHLIKGSGVDLNEFTYQDEIKKEKVRLILPARMLYDKGVMEFIKAGKNIKDKVETIAEFILVGDIDILNLAGIPEEKLRSELDEPYIKWIGYKKNMFEILKDSDIVVLPSYREGLPKSLIEACAVGRPIITTDAPGCRECVKENYNGYLVPIKDYDTLSTKMLLLINDREERHRMGKNSRILAENEFSIDTVIEKHMQIYKLLLK